MTDKVEVLGEIMINFLKKEKSQLIGHILERIKAEGNFFILRQLKDYLYRKNIELSGYKPVKLFLAFDFDENKLRELIEKKFNWRIQIEDKKIDKSLILGGRIKGDDFLIDFSLRRLILKIFEG